MAGEVMALAPVLAAAALLVLAGAPKVLDPGDLVRALRSLGWGVPGPLVRLFALAEVVIGGWALLRPDRLAAAGVAALYLIFTVAVLRGLARGGVLESCGCFGVADTPPTRSHAVVTGFLALAAASGAVVGFGPGTGAWFGGADAALLAAAALIAFLSWQVMAVLPATTPAAIRSIGRS